ncbi:MAG: histidine phosphatase family protein [Aquiluna sp.]|nr:histidine phosphatase family protein [Aquiluna sp.]
MIFVYCDGASRGNPGPASYGVHIEDSNGRTIADFGEGLGDQTNNFAEYQGVIAALRFLTATEFRNLTIRLDSKLVVEQLSGRWKVKSPDIRELVAEASQLLGAFDVKLEWIPREKNTIADSLANRALDEGDFQTREASLPLATIQPRSIRAPRQLVEPTTVVVIRHGSTASTEANLISGGDGDDPVLSSLGETEASLAAAAIPDLLDFYQLPGVSRIVHSPMTRTTQTANAIAATLRIETESDSRLKEIGFGDWEGISMTELEVDSNAAVAAWRNSATSKPPRGESIEELEARVARAVTELVASSQGKTVAIVTHMMPTRAIARMAQRSNDQTNWNINFAPCGISIYRFYGTDFAESFCINSCGHLIHR